MSNEAKQISQARSDGKKDGLAHAKRLMSKHVRLFREFAQITGTRSLFVLGAEFALMSLKTDLEASSPGAATNKVGNA